jgi:hypothetical protein
MRHSAPARAGDQAYPRRRVAPLAWRASNRDRAAISDLIRVVASKSVCALISISLCRFCISSASDSAQMSRTGEPHFEQPRLPAVEANFGLLDMAWLQQREHTVHAIRCALAWTWSPVMPRAVRSAGRCRQQTVTCGRAGLARSRSESRLGMRRTRECQRAVAGRRGMSCAPEAMQASRQPENHPEATGYPAVRAGSYVGI